MFFNKKIFDYQNEVQVICERFDVISEFFSEQQDPIASEVVNNLMHELLQIKTNLDEYKEILEKLDGFTLGWLEKLEIIKEKMEKKK